MVARAASLRAAFRTLLWSLFCLSLCGSFGGSTGPAVGDPARRRGLPQRGVLSGVRPSATTRELNLPRDLIVPICSYPCLVLRRSLNHARLHMRFPFAHAALLPTLGPPATNDWPHPCADALSDVGSYMSPQPCFPFPALPKIATQTGKMLTFLAVVCCSLSQDRGKAHRRNDRGSGAKSNVIS